MNSEIEHAYYGREVAEILQIGNSTLRKWCLALEKQNYKFVRGNNNSRAFVERDILLLRRMRELIQNKSVAIETAAEILLERNQTDERTEVVLKGNNQEEKTHYLSLVIQQNEMLSEILERQERMEEENRKLFQKVQEQNSYIKDKLEERDKKLMTAIRESREQQLQTASALEEKKKGFLRKLLGKV